MKNVSIKKILLAILTLVIGLGLHMGSSRFLKYVGISFTSNILDSFVNEVIFAVVVITILIITKKMSMLSLSKDGLKNGIMAGLPVIIYSIILILVSLSNLQEHTLVKVWEIILFILFCILIGIAEEGLFRGAVQGLVLEAFAAKTKKQHMLGIIVASAIFGCSHFINLRTGANLSSVTIQVISATAAGMLFGGIYVRSGKSLWPSIFTHALMDCGAFINSGMLWGQDEVATINSLSAGALITSVVDVVLFFYIMNKVEKDNGFVTETKDGTNIASEDVNTHSKKSGKKVLIFSISSIAIILLVLLVIIPIVMTSF